MTVHRGREGMTLIEAMIAIVILAIVGTMVWEGFSQTERTKKRLEAQADRTQVLRVALERMARELSMAYVSAQVNPSTALQVVKTAFIGTDQGDSSRVDFTSFSHQRLYRDAHESDQNELSYFVMEDPDDSSKKVLVRREQNRIDDDPQHGGRIEVMVHDVTRFELSYLDPQSTEWVSTWDTTQAAGQPNRLPSQVKILLTLHTPDGKHTVTYGTRAELPLTWALNHAIYNP